MLIGMDGVRCEIVCMMEENVFVMFDNYVLEYYGFGFKCIE